MLCDNCKEELKDTDKYCSNCGTKVNKEPQSFDCDKLKAKVFSSSMKDIIPSTDPLSIDFIKEKKKKKTRKILKIALSSLLILLVFSITLIYINNKDSNNKEGKRTIMIYMIGSDLESKYLAGTKDIDEIIDSSINYNDVNIIIYTGGTKKWHTDKIPNDKQGLFEINSSGIKKIKEFDNYESILEKNNLLYLLNYGYEHYDSEYYDLILWDHGAGPIYGYGYDEYNKTDSMSINEIKSALNSSPFIGDNKLEIIGFDACLMSSIEIASSLSSYANYMVASQEFEPGSGWDYKFLEKIDKNVTSQDFGKLIIDSFDSYYENKKYTKGISLSLLKLSKIDNVLKYIEELFTKIDQDLIIDYSSITRTRSNSKSYGRTSSDYYYDLIDLNDLLLNMPDKYTKEVSNLKSSLSDLIIYQKTDLESTNGVSIFFPFENKKDLDKNLSIYKELNFSESYYNFISNYSKKLTGERLSYWDLSSNNVNSLKEGNILIELTDDQVNNYGSASYILFEKTSDNLFIPIFNGSDTSINGNVLSTTVEKKSIIVKDNLGNEMNVVAIENSRGIDYVSYHIPATVTRFNPDKLEYEVLGVYVDFIVDDNNTSGYISNVYPIELNENLTYSKVAIDLKDWDYLTILSYKYNILDANGIYNNNWLNSEEVNTITVSVKDEIKIEFKDLDFSKEYYSLFKLKDSQGNNYYSNLVKINK